MEFEIRNRARSSSGRAGDTAAANPRQRTASLPPARWLASCLAALLLASTPCESRADATAPAEHLELLQQNGIATATPDIIAYLQRLRPDAAAQVEIGTLVAQLSDPSFARRAAAFERLSQFGEAARDRLDAATRSEDPEVRWRSKQILRKLESGEESQLRQSLTLASLGILQSRREPAAVPAILGTLGLLDDPYARGIAAEALWASAAPSQIAPLTAALDDDNVHVRAAAIVALEVAAGTDAAQRIAPLLESGEAEIRLAAARALIDQLPRQAVGQLVALAAEDDLELACQADALLQMKTGYKPELDEGLPLGNAWKRWSADHLADAPLDQQLGASRLDLSAGRNSLEETFSRDAASLAKGYGPFLYEADNGAPAAVAQGKLRLDGNNPEGDQRLYITSRRMIGRDRWPDNLEVRARMAGEDGNNFGWHMGVSVGRIKTLFHPGLGGGGGFRAETTDDHTYLFSNQRMSFEPVTGVTHEMIIRVTKTAKGADFDITVKGGNGGAPHLKKFSVTDEQLGDFDRIGLERSGRTGGSALFDSVAIRLGR